jgi:hypothetical protein
MVVRASGDGILLHLELTDAGALLWSSDGYDGWNEVSILRWCSPTRETDFKGGGTMWWHAAQARRRGKGKTAGEVLHGSFYRGKSPGMFQTTFWSLSPKESKIDSVFH